MIRRPPRSTLDRSSAASDVYKRQPRRRPAVPVVGLAIRELAGRGRGEPLRPRPGRVDLERELVDLVAGVVVVAAARDRIDLGVARIDYERSPRDDLRLRTGVARRYGRRVRIRNRGVRNLEPLAHGPGGN